MGGRTKKEDTIIGYSIYCKNKEIARKVKSLREERGISQEKLANYISVTAATICHREKTNQVGAYTGGELIEIARLFGVSAEYFIS